MKIFLNFIPLKSGGGVQVGLDFISNISLATPHEWTLFATRGTPFEKLKDTFNGEVYLVESNIPQRLFFELIGFRKYLLAHQPDLIYTQFGPHWHTRGIINVVGCAYSNLFYPEVNFWGGLKWPLRFIKEIKDWYRLKRLQSADHVVFETKDLACRAVAQGKLDNRKVHFVKPAVSNLVSGIVEHLETKTKCNSIPSAFRICLISGYHHNKNIEALVAAAQCLKNNFKDENIVFILTLPVDSSGTKQIIQMAKLLNVNHYFHNLGPIAFEGCSEVYRASNASILLSTLESFSNNIAESWAMKCPLMIADMDWARSICGNGAIYINQQDGLDIAKKVIELKNNNSYQMQIIQKGTKRLREYSSSRERFNAYRKIMEAAARH